MGGPVEAAGGEELDDGEAAEDPPELAVGGPRVGGVVVGEVVAGEGGGAVGEDDVVGGEAVIDGGGRGDDEEGFAAEAEREDGAEVGGEGG